MAGPDSPHARILASEVFMRGANRPFGELTAEDVRLRAQELRDAVGWGPTARVAPVAQAWRELALTMERAAAGTVAELAPDALDQLAGRLWVVLPSAAPRDAGQGGRAAKSPSAAS